MAAAAVVVVGLLASALTAGAADDPVIDRGAEPAAVATRGTVVQQGAFPLGPGAGGCLPKGATLSTVVTAGGNWTLGVVNTRWHVGYRGAAGVRGGVVLVGDSLTLYSLNETMAALIAAGYGPICVDAGYGRGITLINLRTVSTGVEVIRRIAASDVEWGGRTVTWVIALGTNDVVYTSSASITSVATTKIGAADAAVPAGAGRVLWIDLRTARSSTQFVENVWDQFLAAHHSVIGWSAAVLPATATYLRDDLVHPTAAGVALRVQLLMAAVLTI